MPGMSVLFFGTTHLPTCVVLGGQGKPSGYPIADAIRNRWVAVTVCGT
jgi:hypothetical protein